MHLNRNFFLIVIALFSLSSCANAPLLPGESAVRILRKSDPPLHCQELGKVFASGLASLSEIGRESDLKRNTYKIGGDTVTLDRRDEHQTIYGTAFKCN